MPVSTVSRKGDTLKFRRAQIEAEDAANWRRIVKRETMIKVFGHLVVGMLLATAFLTYLHATETHHEKSPVTASATK